MWWTGAALGFDTETDGRDPLDARIITAAMVLVTPGNRPTEMEVMLQPEREIPQEAIDVHGITNERALAEGALREVGITQIATTIAELAGPDIPLVAHNASYDLTALDREMRRVGIGRLGHEVEVGRSTPMVSFWLGGQWITSFPVIDTFVLDKAVDRYRKGKRQLSHVAAHYGVPMAEGAAHGATADTIAALRIAITIANRDPREIGAMTLAELHAAQIRWAAEQARGLREYFIKSGTGDPAGVSEAWPLRTLTDGASEVEDISTELV